MRYADMTPSADLTSLALAVCRRFVGGRDYGKPGAAARLAPWITDDVIHDAVSEAWAATLSDLDGAVADPDALAVEPDFRRAIVGRAKAFLRSWAATPSRYLGRGVTGTADLDAAADMADPTGWDDHVELQEEAEAVRRSLAPAHRATLDAIASRTAVPALTQDAWHQRCSRALQALREALAARGHRPVQVPDAPAPAAPGFDAPWDARPDAMVAAVLDVLPAPAPAPDPAPAPLTDAEYEAAKRRTLAMIEAAPEQRRRRLYEASRIGRHLVIW